MLPVKLFILDALIENLVNVLAYTENTVFADVYLDMLERLLHTRRALRSAR